MSLSGLVPAGASLTFGLPGNEPGVSALAVLEVMLVGNKNFQTQQSALRSACRIREATQGVLVKVSASQMLAALSRDDAPIRFYETLPDAVWHAKGVAVPSDFLPVVK
jgi:hypothetical protein